MQNIKKNYPVNSLDPKQDFIPVQVQVSDDAKDALRTFVYSLLFSFDENLTLFLTNLKSELDSFDKVREVKKDYTILVRIVELGKEELVDLRLVVAS